MYHSGDIGSEHSEQELQDVLATCKQTASTWEFTAEWESHAIGLASDQLRTSFAPYSVDTVAYTHRTE